MHNIDLVTTALVLTEGRYINLLYVTDYKKKEKKNGRRRRS
jgi:hypothetical protein